MQAHIKIKVRLSGLSVAALSKIIFGIELDRLDTLNTVQQKPCILPT